MMIVKKQAYLFLDIVHHIFLKLGSFLGCYIIVLDLLLQHNQKKRTSTLEMYKNNQEMFTSSNLRVIDFFNSFYFTLCW